jgi:biuret amidohydrolase
MADYIDVLTHDFTLQKGKCALLVVDMQYASGSRQHGLGRWLSETGTLDSAAYRFDRIENVVVPGIARLLAAFRAAGERVIYITLGAENADYSDAPKHMQPFFRQLNNHVGTREHDIIDELKPEPGEIIVNKVTQGAFASSRIDQVLRSTGITQVVLVGVSTNNCVETTAREASDRGYDTVLVSDATGTCSDEMQNVTIKGFRRLWGRVMTIDEVSAEIAEKGSARREDRAA